MLLTYLSKAFDCRNHELLIAKLNAYGFNLNALNLIHSYLTDRVQRVRIQAKYSCWSDIITGVPQGSILGPLFFNIYLSDIFLFTSDCEIANYADDNTPYCQGKNIEFVMSQLEKDTNLVVTWVVDNSMRANPDKFNLLSDDSDTNLSIKVDNYEIKTSNEEKLLGITFDYKLTFETHVAKLCKKANQKMTWSE